MDIEELAQMLETIDMEPVTPEVFMKHAKLLGEHSTKLDQEQQLTLYALYKQATVGDNNTPKPPSEDIVASTKWQVWESVKGFPKDASAKVYVYLVQEVANGDEKDGKKNVQGFGVIHSTLLNAEEDNSAPWQNDEALFPLIIDNNAEGVKKLLEDNSIDVNAKNQEGRTALHIAADRGIVELCTLLLDHGADVNSQDSNNLMTALMYAVVCEHETVGKLLIERGAKLDLTDSDGLTVRDYDLSDGFESLLSSK